MRSKPNIDRQRDRERIIKIMRFCTIHFSARIDCCEEEFGHD